MRLMLMCGAAVGGLALAVPADAETLRDALLRTYQGNPTLTGARAQQRATDESVSIARARGRPTIGATADLDRNYAGVADFGNGTSLFTAGANVDVPIYQGGAVRNSIRAADARVRAGRDDLRAVEGDIFTAAVAAYMDVIRDESIVQLNENQVRVLGTNSQASRDRFEVGDLTRTDVAQSDARLLAAESDLAAARGRLTASRENYRRITGATPTALEPPPPLPPLPETPELAVGVALDRNPQLAAIKQDADAARLDVRVAQADRLPRLSVGGGVLYSDYLGTRSGTGSVPLASDHSTDGRVGVGLTLPLYQGGLVGARVRQAQAIESQTIERTIEIERGVIADVRGAFASYVAANETIRSSEAAVSANRLALEGTRAEQGVGTRNVLDVLNAEQELVNAEVELVTARRDAYVAGFALLNVMGRVELRELGLDGGAFYDPTINYQRVRGKIFDWSDDPKPTPVATRTVESGTQPTVVVEPVRQPPAPRPEPLAPTPANPPRN